MSHLIALVPLCTQAVEGKATAAQYYADSIAVWSGQSEAYYWLAQQKLARGKLDDAEDLLRRSANRISTRLGGGNDDLLQEHLLQSFVSLINSIVENRFESPLTMPT